MRSDGRITVLLALIVIPLGFYELGLPSAYYIVYFILLVAQIVFMIIMEVKGYKNDKKFNDTYLNPTVSLASSELALEKEKSEKKTKSGKKMKQSKDSSKKSEKTTSKRPYDSEKPSSAHNGSGRGGRHYHHRSSPKSSRSSSRSKHVKDTEMEIKSKRKPLHSDKNHKKESSRKAEPKVGSSEKKAWSARSGGESSRHSKKRDGVGDFSSKVESSHGSSSNTKRTGGSSRDGTLSSRKRAPK